MWLNKLKIKRTNFKFKKWITIIYIQLTCGWINLIKSNIDARSYNFDRFDNFDHFHDFEHFHNFDNFDYFDRFDSFYHFNKFDRFNNFNHFNNDLKIVLILSF